MTTLTAWLGSLAAALFFAGVMIFLDAPAWAIVGFAYLGFILWRLGDKVDGKP